jgi:hypothetical protein
MARPTKYSQALEVGCTYELASRYGGISFDTFLRWRKRYACFATQLQASEGKATLRWLVKINQAAGGDWRAAAWKLERRYPRDYGRTVQEQHLTGDAEQPVSLRLVRDG